MKKIKLFVDFDNTIVDSTKAICDMYNNHFKDKEGFVLANPTKCMEWDFSDVCTLATKEWLNGCFGRSEFFLKLKFLEGARKSLKELSLLFDIYIVSIGDLMNISMKSVFIESNLPFIKNVVLIKNENCNMDKSIVDMSDGILIDDNPQNLISSNAKDKILFGRDYNYNRGFDFERIYTWNSLKNTFYKE